MSEEKIDQKHPAHADSDLHKVQQRPDDAKSGDAKRQGNEIRAEQDVGRRTETGGTARRVVDQASDLAQEAYRRGGEYLEQGRGALPSVQQARRAVAQPVQNHPVAALIAAGAVGYGLAWLIHRGTGQATSSRSRGRSYTPAQHPSLNTAHPEAEEYSQQWPSGDSPKPHGDKLPNMVKIAPDNQDRY